MRPFVQIYYIRIDKLEFNEKKNMLLIYICVRAQNNNLYVLICIWLSKQKPIYSGIIKGSTCLNLRQSLHVGIQAKPSDHGLGDKIQVFMYNGFFQHLPLFEGWRRIFLLLAIYKIT